MNHLTMTTDENGITTVTTDDKQFIGEVYRFVNLCGDNATVTNADGVYTANYDSVPNRYEIQTMERLNTRIAEVTQRFEQK